MIVEFIPKQEQKPIFGQVFFLIVSAAVLAGVVVAFFILQQLLHSARLELNQVEKTLVEDTKPLEEELFSELQEYKRQTEILKVVLLERKILLPFFSLLERTTHPDVFFQTFQGDAKTGVFELEGEARDFFVLEQQRLAWKGLGEFETELSGIKLGDEGSGLFEAKFVVRPGLLDPL
ncbi:MAG: hypothetical protein HYT49_02930 [Candidatus Wildermuthbacteria bacterium]|nr:hypothetical protein [Candidatus Wildermuthbacteria bacterium]